jgi:DNA-binding LacI/PurR family transcriptional regulator
MIAAERTNEFVEACEQYRCPYVLVETEYRVISDKGVQITTNNHQAIVDVMHYLFSLGHQRIAYVAGYFRNQSMQERLEGYRSALHEAALAYVPDWVVETNWSHQQGYERARQLLSLDPRPTAVLCGNDLIAFGVMQAVQESGLPIGSGVSVVGFDDIEMASEVSPSLTTMRQPMRQMGEIAFTQLHKMLKGEAPDSRSIQLPAELIVRETTGPVKTN